jgi:hypothetical protein
MGQKISRLQWLVEESEEQMATQDSVTIPVHKPRLEEKLFFLLSGAIVSVPLTLFISQLSDYLFLSMSGD